MSLQARTALYIGYCLIVAAANADAVVALVLHTQRDPAASHLILIPFVSGALLFLNRQPIVAASRDSRFRNAWTFAGFATLVAGALAVSFAPAGAALSIRILTLVAAWIAGFAFWFGIPAVKAARFPLFFLVFFVPIPATLLEGAVYLLQKGSTQAVAGLFTITGTPFFRDGFTFGLPNVEIEIGDACSGLRSSIALLLVGLLCSHLFLCRGWTKLVLVLAVVPLAILKNAVRIATLCLLSIHVDPGYLQGPLHQDGGIVFFALALALLACVLILLRRMEPIPASPAGRVA